MKIDATRSDTSKNIKLNLSGTPGDDKQPIRWLYLSTDITPKAALKLGSQLTHLGKLLLDQEKKS